jgi:coniferyl-aldehyde dehydrogenase
MHSMNRTEPTPGADRALHATLALQRAAFLRNGPPTLKQRRRDLKKLKDAILARQDAFVAALDADFGHRARQESQMLDLGSTVGGTNYLYSNLRRFMRPERRHVEAIFKPASATVVYQPLGVVGIVAPWNFPVSLSLTPLATALAAGNRAMLKPSEMTPATTELLASLRTGRRREGERRSRCRARDEGAKRFSITPISADAAARRHRRDGGDAGGDLRPNPAGRHL